MSEQNALIAALIKARSEFPEIPKNKTAKVKTRTGADFTYSYADLSEILSVICPILSKHGLMLSQPVKYDDAGSYVETTILHLSGQHYLLGSIRLKPIADPQQFGSELSYLRRYALMTALGFMPEDDTDAQDVKIKPAEEPKQKTNPIKPTTQPRPEAPKQEEARGDRMRRAMKVRGWTKDQVVEVITGTFNKTELKSLTPLDFQSVVDHVEMAPPGTIHPFCEDPSFEFGKNNPETRVI